MRTTPAEQPQSKLVEAGMLLLRAKAFLVGVAILFSVLQGCSQPTKISDLMSDPARYRGKDVTIAGNVTESFGALGAGAYQVDDGSGKIWIIAQQTGVPAKGTHVQVTGRLLEGATVGTRSLGTALRETRRKT
jgi:hypothetical protein